MLQVRFFVVHIPPTVRLVILPAFSEASDYVWRKRKGAGIQEKPDSDIGFEVEAATQAIASASQVCKERIRLVNGIITIQSKPGVGTTIHACVPFRAEHESQRVAG